MESRGMEMGEFQIGLLMLPLLALSFCLWINIIWRWKQLGWPLPFRLRRSVPWSPFEAVAVIVVILFVVTGALLQLLSDPVTNSRVAGSYTLRQVQIQCLSQTVELALIPFVLSLWHLCYWHDFGVNFRDNRLDLGIAVWGMILVQLPMQLCEFPFRALRKTSPHPVLELLQISMGDWQTFGWIVLQVVVLAPLLEELLFRVVLQGALSRDSSPAVAIGFSSAAFVCIHQPVDWAPLFPLALTLGYVYYRRQSYLAVVVLHALFNALNLLLAFATLPSGTPVR